MPLGVHVYMCFPLRAYRRRHVIAKDSSGKGNDLSLLSSGGCCSATQAIVKLCLLPVMLLCL
jgi:hypothetical protein